MGVLLAASCFAQRLEVDLVKQQVIQERLKDGVVPPAKRQAAIRDLFEQAGCSPQEQAISKKTANIICTLPGETSSTIVVGGHFDFADRGAGIVDDWSGVSLLPRSTRRSRPTTTGTGMCSSRSPAKSGVWWVPRIM